METIKKHIGGAGTTPAVLIAAMAARTKKDWQDVLKDSQTGYTLAKALFLEGAAVQTIESLLVGIDIVPRMAKKMTGRYELSYLRDEVRQVLDTHQDILSGSMPESTIEVLVKKTVLSIAQAFESAESKDLLY